MTAVSGWNPYVVVAIERVVSHELGREWRVGRVADLGDRASHPCALLHGDRLVVFAKLDGGDDGAARLAAELAGLWRLRDAGVAVATPIGEGIVATGHGAVLLTEGLVERPPGERTIEEWRAIGAALARLHVTHGDRFGLATDGWFGPLRQDDRPVPSDTWVEFYRERRVGPYLRAAGAGRRVRRLWRHHADRRRLRRTPRAVAPARLPGHRRRRGRHRVRSGGPGPAGGGGRAIQSSGVRASTT